MPTSHLVGDRVTFESNGTDTIYYTYEPDGKILSMNLNGTEYYYIFNGQNDIIGLVNNSGTQVVVYTYDTWGKLISITGSLASTVGVKNPYRYRSYRYDTETGLYYLQSRYYNPEWGRWLNVDAPQVIKNAVETMMKNPVKSKDGLLIVSNLFAYCFNNPVKMVDYNGYIAELAIEGAAGLTIAFEAGAAMSWNPVGWVFLGVVAVATIGYSGYKLYEASKNKTVTEILKTKKGSIRNAPLPPGSPSWDTILNLTLAEIQRRAQQGLTGYDTLYKLLTDSRFNR